MSVELLTFLDSGFHAMESEFRVLDSGFLISGTWIPDLFSCIPDSKVQDSLIPPDKIL